MTLADLLKECGAPQRAPARQFIADFFNVTSPGTARALESVVRVMNAKPEAERWGSIGFADLSAACAADLGGSVWNGDLSAALQVLGYKPRRVYKLSRGHWLWERPRGLQSHAPTGRTPQEGRHCL